MVDNVSVTQGAGTAIATDEVGGVHYQRVKPAVGADGSAVDVSRANPMPVQIETADPLYRLFVPAAAVGASKVFFDLFNATGSGKTLRLISCVPIVSGAVAVTGTLGVDLFLTRTSAVGTGGTAAVGDAVNGGAASAALNALSIGRMDPADAQLPAGVSARLAPAGGATAGQVLAMCSVFTEETNAASYLGHFNDLAKRISPRGNALMIPENTGIRIVQGTVASVGNVGFDLAFEAI